MFSLCVSLSSTTHAAAPGTGSAAGGVRGSSRTSFRFYWFAAMQAAVGSEDSGSRRRVSGPG